MQESKPQALHIVDLSLQQPDPPDFDPPHHKLVRGKTRAGDRVFTRKYATIDGIVIHQTACPFGVTEQQTRAAGGDRVKAKHMRALGVAAHMTAFDTGYAVLAHPLDWYVFHANTLNARSLGIEIEGRFPELKGDKDLLTGSLLQAARDGVAYLVQKGRALGMPIKYVWAHRQSSPTRPADPGQEIWQKLVLGYAVPELGLVAQPDFVTGGEALPEEWRRSGSR